MLVNTGSLVESSKESNLELRFIIFLSHNLGWPVGKTFLFGVDYFMKRSTRLSKPVLVSPTMNNC